MTSELISIIILVATMLSIIIYTVIAKKQTIKKIDKGIDQYYSKVKSLLGSYIEKWDESKLLDEGEQIYNIIKSKDIDNDKVNRFTSYYKSMNNIIYKNNLSSIENQIKVIKDKYLELCGNGNKYIISSDIVNLSEDLVQESKEVCDKAIKYDSVIIKDYLKVYESPEHFFNEVNLKYLNNEKSMYKSMFDNIENKSLDENQRNAVVNDDMRQLVIAGAGSGKTLTIAAKVKYLVERKGINPKDILLLSFTKKAANEMKERIGRIGIDIDSSTFHKYGLGIIGKVDRKLPNVYNDIKGSVDDFLRNVIYTNEEDTRNFLRLLGILMLPNYKPNQSFGEMISEDRMYDLTTLKGMYESNVNEIKRKKIQKEIDEKQKEIDILDYEIEFLLSESRPSNNVEEKRKLIYELNQFINEREKNKLTIRNEQVKSREEVKIANLLFLDGIEYEYEAEYPYDTKDNYRKRYCPDFYLNNDDVYLEHFGLNKFERAPQYNSSDEFKYLEGVIWKENLHKTNNTRLIKTYSWQFQENVIEEHLRKEYNKFGIKTKKVDYRHVIREILKSESNIDAIDSLVNLLTTFINLFKSNNYSFQKFDELILEIDNAKPENSEDSDNIEHEKERNISFLKFAKSFYKYYTEMLRQEKMIDFNDMINHATKLVKDSIYTPKYRYVIIDEYQDISMGRYKLIKETLDKSGAKLFCVGDDWQSIYRFTGSEVSLFIEFEKYYGKFSKTDITKTYRNSQELLDIAGNFISMNTNQIKKELKSDKNQKLPVRIRSYETTSNIIYDDEEQAPIPYSIAYAFDDALKDMITTVPNTKQVIVLGRNNGDIRRLNENTRTHISQIDGDTVIQHKDFPELEIIYYTVHRAKGLEAENVIILNLENSRSGFPNQIADDPILDLLRESNDSYPFAEERRLFYVALTRTKNLVYLLVPNNNYSRFIDDLHQITKSKESIAKDLKSVVNCPKCKTGVLVKRKGYDNRTFVGCSNYPRCDYKVSNLKTVKKENRCPSCGDFLVRRNGKYGEFMGCNSYPACRYTREI